MPTPRRNPDTFDPINELEYIPPQYTDSARYYRPDENSTYYLGDEHEERGAPVQLTDDMIMRAHYLELGMSHLLQKYREGRLSDAEYIQYHRMNGELRSLLNHIWNVGKRALRYWVDNHLRGGNASYGIGLFDIRQLIETLQQLGLSPDAALAELEPIVGGTEDWQDDLRRYSIGAPQLYDSYEYEDEDQQEYERALAEAGISDLNGVVPTDQDKWNFLKERLENWYDEDEMAAARTSYDDKGPTPLWQKKVTPRGVDTANPEQFLSGESDSDDDEYFASQRGGYLNDDEWDRESPHVDAYANLRSNPQYQAAIDDEMARRWNPVNSMQAHRELLRELDISDEEWDALDTQTQMALMSRLFQAQHRTGNILTDVVPSFQFTSGRYEPRGDWVGWKMGNEPSLESNALRNMLDDMNQSEMVNEWDRYFEQNPHRRWSMVRDDMVRMAMTMDAKGAYDLADRMDRLAGLDDIDDPAPYAPREDPQSGPTHEEVFMRHYPTYRDAMPQIQFLHTVRMRVVAHLKKHPEDMRARVQLHAIDEYLSKKEGRPIPRADIPEGEGEPDFGELSRNMATSVGGGGGEEPFDMRGMFSTPGVSWGTSAPYAISEPHIEKVGYADIKRVSVEVITPDDVGSVVPIARQMVYQWLKEHGVDDPGEAVQFRPSAAQNGQRMFIDQNQSSESVGKKKRGYVYSISFEIVEPSDRDFVFDMSRGETWHDIASRARKGRQ